jgi:hypothetical protein
MSFFPFVKIDFSAGRRLDLISALVTDLVRETYEDWSLRVPEFCRESLGKDVDGVLSRSGYHALAAGIESGRLSSGDICHQY